MAIPDKILEDIRNNKCILFLGPLITAIRYKGQRSSLNKLFTDHILEKIGNGAAFEVKEEIARNPSYLVNKYIQHLGGRSNFETEIKPRFSEFFDRPSSIYYLLAKLPFNTIINFGFDRSMQRGLNKNRFEFSDKYYDYNGDNKQHLEGIEKNFQLVYNLLGSINDLKSLVLTEDDQLAFMKKILGGPKIPDNVLSRIKEDPQERKSYIFLGFNFEEWHFRFLLDTLQLPKAVSTIAPKIPGYKIAVMTEEFYGDRFGMKFLDDSPEDFAKLLTREYAEKYGVNTHRFGFISYHDDDEKIAQDFKVFLDNQKLGKRIEFWDKSKLEAGDNKQQVTVENLAQATIYLPFINARLLNDAAFRKELRKMLDRDDVLTFPVITRNCDFETDFPDLRARATLLLPTSDGVLITAAKPAIDDDEYITIIKKINSKIR